MQEKCAKELQNLLKIKVLNALNRPMLLTLIPNRDIRVNQLHLAVYATMYPISRL
ncbi:hypothetical protein PHSC3_000841 [Chlamydiales bacterium STE3]|nr:hypothetical protein PHSC3_000841 [Chlamydiales bacterium STE3]